MARYTSAGIWFSARRDAARPAVRPGRLVTAGEAFTIQEGVGGDASSGAGHFGVSAGGLLAYVPKASIPNESVLVLLDRAGHESERCPALPR